MRWTAWMVAGGLLVATGALAEAPCTPKSLGAGVEIAEATPIVTIASKPQEFVGRSVRVEGEVKAVCAAAGCWLDLVADGGAAIRVKVDDGDIVFPMAAKGKRAAAQGTVEMVEMSREGYVAARRHEADETGVPFDESTVGDGPFRLVSVKGTGAEVCF
jgi:hypothetical protein